MTTAERLAAPFPADLIGWKPQAVKGNRALAIPYIDARDVAERLDEVLGMAAWSDDYTPLPDGSVMCRLTCDIDGKPVTKCDVGGMSDQPDAGDRLKSAFSDALKRAAVKFGIGRYLYRLPQSWTDYDPVKKQVTPPRLPDWALPSRQPASKPAAPVVAIPPDAGKYESAALPPAVARSPTTGGAVVVPAAETEVITEGDPITDSAAVTELVARKGVGYGSVITKLNAKYGTKYHATRTKWLTIPREQREAIIAAVQGMPDKTPAPAVAKTPADEVWELYAAWGKATHMATDYLVNKARHTLKITETLEEMDTGQLAAMTTHVRAEQLGK